MEPWQNLLIHLFHEGRSWVNSLDRTDWRRQISDRKIDQTKPSLQVMNDVGEVCSWINSVNNIGAEKRKGFVIAPGKHSTDALLLLAPFVLSLDQNPRLSLQLGFTLENNDDSAFFGYRFESPEEYSDGDDDSEDTNEHDYYHAQPIKTFGRDGENSRSIAWYPVRYPAFPLDAKCSIELIASMLLSSWGCSSLTKLATSNSIRNDTKKDLRQFIEKVRRKS